MREIWILNHYAQTPSMPGGTRHYELAKRLVTRGFNVTILASAYHHPTRATVPHAGALTRQTEIDGVRFAWIPARFHYKGNSIVRMLNMLEFAVRAWWRGRRLGGGAARPDVVIGSSPHLLTAVSAERLSKRHHARFVLEIRDLWPESLVALGGFSRRHPLIRILSRIEAWLYRTADHIISLLPEARTYLETKNVRPECVTWISNGANIPEKPGPKRDARNGLQAVYVGAHGQANVLDDLLTAAGILQERDVELMIRLIGDGPAKPALAKRASDEGLRNVEFVNPVPKSDIPSVLGEADVAIALTEDTPLYEYGISLNKLFDYFAAGRPILFAGNVAHDYVAIAQAGRTVAPRCPACIADGLMALAECSATERAAMGARGREYLREHHTWDVLASRLDRVLRSCEPREGSV